MRLNWFIIKRVPRNEMKMRVRDDLCCAGAVVLDNVVVGLRMWDVGHGGGDESARKEGEHASDLESVRLMLCKVSCMLLRVV